MGNVSAMTPFEKILKDFNIPNLKDIEDKDVALINEFMKTGNSMFLCAIILRLLGNNKLLSNTMLSLSEENEALIVVNNNLLSVIENHEERMSALEKKLEDVFIVDKGGKHTH